MKIKEHEFLLAYGELVKRHQMEFHSCSCCGGITVHDVKVKANQIVKVDYSEDREGMICDVNTYVQNQEEV